MLPELDCHLCTVFIFTRIPDLNERILHQTSESVVHTYRAQTTTQKALSVLQSTTVYHSLHPPTSATTSPPTSPAPAAPPFIPVVIVPGINEVLYVEDQVGAMKLRIEYLQYLLDKRRELVDMHKPTIQAM